MKRLHHFYRNLHKDRWSRRERGKVQDHPDKVYAVDVEFRVGEAGRQRVIREQKKNVHAYVAAHWWSNTWWGHKDTVGNPSGPYVRVRYNPYSAPHFTCNGFRVNRADRVILDRRGRCWAWRPRWEK